jgi:hypothetical protein
MNEPTSIPEPDPRAGPEEAPESFYLNALKLSDGSTKIRRLKPWELRCMVNETFRQPKRGTRGPKPLSWEVAVQRIQKMLNVRDAIRRTGNPVSKRSILNGLGLRGREQIIDRWLDLARLTWEDFLDLRN